MNVCMSSARLCAPLMPAAPMRHALCREMVQRIAQDGYLVVTWANWHYQVRGIALAGAYCWQMPSSWRETNTCWEVASLLRRCQEML